MVPDGLHLVDCSDELFRYDHRVPLRSLGRLVTEELLHVRDVPVHLDLAGPGATAALELYSRWPRGVPFSLESKDAPAWQCILIVLKGQVDVQCRDQMFAMHAPPGAALIETTRRTAIFSSQMPDGVLR